MNETGPIDPVQIFDLYVQHYNQLKQPAFERDAFIPYDPYLVGTEDMPPIRNLQAHSGRKVPGKLSCIRRSNKRSGGQ